MSADPHLVAELRASVLELAENARGESWTEYERLRRLWRSRHPNVPHAYYAGFMRLLSRRLGLS